MKFAADPEHACQHTGNIIAACWMQATL
jgi:hypothetical protein